MTNLAELLRERALNSSLDKGYTFLDSDGQVKARLSYRALHTEAICFAQTLRQRFPKDDRVILLCPQGEEFIVGFFACIYAGLIPVPIATQGTLATLTGRLAAIAVAAQANVILLPETEQQRGLAGCLSDSIPRSLAAISLGKRHSSEADSTWEPSPCSPETTAFLQFTSGSTSDPRGVVVKHKNVIANQNMIRRAFGTCSNDRILSWLPPYHDMGLIGGIIHPLFVDAECFLMSPQDFARKPGNWLRAISQHSVTVSGGPNTAFRVCSSLIVSARDVDEGIDLTSWRVAFCGAEPVSPQDLENFAATYRPYGFRRDSFHVCYGLAEATLIVSAGQMQTLNKQDPSILHSPVRVSLTRLLSDSIISCGHILSPQQVRIVQSETTAAQPDGTTGEVWISGPNVAAGYWNKPDATKASFGLSLPGHIGLFLRTGDLGFIWNAELYVTGRMKDLLIVGGSNIYPQDIEACVLDMLPPEVSGGTAVAFQHDASSSTSDIVLAIEVRHTKGRELSHLAEQLLLGLRGAYGLPVGRLLLVRRGTIPRTTSGKVRRNASRQKFVEQGAKVLYDISVTDDPSPARDLLFDPADQESVVQLLTQVVSDSLGASMLSHQQLIGGHSPTSLGVDSLRAARISETLRTRYRISISPGDILDSRSISELAKMVSSHEFCPTDGHREASPTIDQSTCPLTPDQLRLWVLEQTSLGQTDLIIQVGVTLSSSFTPEEVLRALAQANAEHPMLRASVYITRGRPQFLISPSSAPTGEIVDLSQLPNDERIKSVSSRLVRSHLRPFSPDEQHMWRALVIRLPDNKLLLVVTVHHLIADAHSIAVLLRSVTHPKASLSNANESATSSFLEFANQKTTQKVAERNLTFWREVLSTVPAYPASRRSRHENTRDDLQRVEYTIDTSLLELSVHVARTHHTTLFNVLLSVWQMLQFFITDRSVILTAIPLAGRPLPNFGSTIGMFAHPAPVWSCFGEALTFDDLLSSVSRSIRGFQMHADSSLADAIQADGHLGTAARHLGYDGIFTALDASAETTSENRWALNFDNARFGTSDFAASSLIVHFSDKIQGVIDAPQSLTRKEERFWSYADYAKLLAEVLRRPSALIEGFRSSVKTP